MMTMDLLEQDNYYDTTPTTTPSIPSSVGEYNEDYLDYCFWMRWPLRSCIFMVDVLVRMVTLVCLRQNTRVSFMGWLDTFSFVSGLNAWTVVFGVEHEEYLVAVDLTPYVGTIPTWLASYFLV